MTCQRQILCAKPAKENVFLLMCYFYIKPLDGSTTTVFNSLMLRRRSWTYSSLYEQPDVLTSLLKK